MKFGFRTPSIKKSIKARTTGKIKRSIKLSPKTEKIIAIFAYIISTIIIGYILILVISFVIGIIKGFIV